ncbi:non-ribosomal peptide synthetase [Streptomyces sp. ISL-86]|uniref:non-ribosomal peptide synthetase n=1 Tax=Streptomyces sp. ISL-86 TaxID=2819187 RepID=UPI001BEC37C2|nr:non-ribosomal peptide synthetase [Streptomyces sp. ISL-86]MBT2458179.1 amino acid adenylation domain-containing protein [Streptomyces sp. ISL-86]
MTESLAPNALPRVGAEYDDFPASPAQARLWALQRFFPQMAVYNFSIVLRFDDDLDVPALQQAVDALIERHESLRTVFVSAGGLVQRVRRPGSARTRCAVEVVDVKPDESGEVLQSVLDAADAVCRRQFDLGDGPLVRAAVLRASGINVLALIVHHSVIDGWSGPIVIDELAAFYRAALTGEPVSLDPLPVQAADIAMWEHGRLDAARRSRLVGFWRQRLAGLPGLNLVSDRPRPATSAFTGTRHTATVPAATVRALHALCQEHHVTTYMALLAATSVVVGRWARQDDVPLLAQVAQRPLPAAQSVVGFFVNGVVVRTGLDGQPTFRELLDRVCDEFLDALEHADLPFDEVVQALNPQREMNRNPLAQVAVSLERADRPAEFAGLRATPVDVHLGTSVDLDILFEENGADSLSVTVLADSELFDAQTAAELTASLTTALTGLVEQPDRPALDVELVDPARATLAADETSSDYPYSSVQALFEQQVARTPEAPAVYHPDGVMTYGELNAQVNRLSRTLRAHGIELETPVGLCMQRSLDRIVAVLAILKAGGCYVPMLAGDPAERLRVLVADSGVELVLTDDTSAAAFEWCDRAVPWADLTERAGHDVADPEPLAGGASLAHIIYTSGSTGRPNAVAVAQHSLARLVRGSLYHEFGPADVCLELSPLTFDASLVELWGPLLNGGAIAVVPEDNGRLGLLDQLRAGLHAYPVTMVQLISPQLGLVVENAPELLSRLDTVFVGGDVLSPQTAARARALQGGNATLLHMYGPTESTLFATYEEIREVSAPHGRLPIGRPIGNTTAYVVDEGGNLVPPCAPGELLLGGAGLARGYAGQPALTAKRFVPDPFSGSPGARLYRTGDLVRRLPDGRIEFLGRVDHQVKVRGHRIETGEVATALRSHPQVADAVVVVRADLPGGPDLVAYVVAEPAGAANTEQLRTHLRQILPQYMIPAAFVPLPALPLTRHAKLDLAALPPVVPAAASAEAPRSDTEREVASLWHRLLGVEELDRSRTFFDSGGNSLLLIQLAEAIAARYPECGLKIGDLFEYTTIARLGKVLDERREAGRRSQ